MKKKPKKSNKLKKTKKIKKNKKKAAKSKTFKKFKKNQKKKNKKIGNNKKIIFRSNIKKTHKESLILKLVKFQLSLKPEFNFKINFSLEKYIQRFFDKISETISSYKILKHDEKRRLKIEKIENERKEKIALQKKKLKKNF